MAWDLSNVIINLKAKISELSSQIPGIATTSKAGIVKPDGTTITVTSEGAISAASPTIPVATTEAAGIVKPDGTSITIDDGVISTPVATTEAAGIVKPDGTTITIEDGVISAAGSEPKSVTITKTSGETWSSIIARLRQAIDITKLKGTSYVKCKNSLNYDMYARLTLKTSSGEPAFDCEYNHVSLNGPIGISFGMAASSSNIVVGEFSNGNKTVVSTTEYPGDSITLYY